MKRLLKIGCLFICVFFCFSCTKQEEQEPTPPVTLNPLLDTLMDVIEDYDYSFDDETSLYAKDEHEKGIMGVYVAGDNDTRICYFSYENETYAKDAYRYDQSVFENDQQSSLKGHHSKEDYEIMYSTQTYVDNDVVGATPRVLHTYSILKQRYIVVIVSSDESIAKALLSACQFSY